MSESIYLLLISTLNDKYLDLRYRLKIWLYKFGVITNRRYEGSVNLGVQTVMKH